MSRRALLSLLGGATFLGVAVCSCFFPAPAQAIECLSAPDHSDSGWWSWREIDGRKCWFKKVGAIPPKSQLSWPERDKQVPLTEPMAQQEAASMESSEANASLPQIKVARVKPVEAREPNYRLGDDRVRLLYGINLSGPGGVGSIWETPTSIDSFDARYGEWSDRNPTSGRRGKAK